MSPSRTARASVAAGQAGASWAACMARGRFAQAWRIRDRVLADIGPLEWQQPRHCQRIWRGQPLAGARVLVRCYHGLGDTIQFLRYLPAVTAEARQVTVWIQPPLLSLVPADSPTLQLLPLHDGAPEVPYDVDVEIMELAHVYRTTAATVPNRVPYLRRPALSTAPQTSPGRPLRVGLAWRAGGWDPSRSLPARDFFDLVACLECEPVTLQGDLLPAEQALFPGHRSRTLPEVAHLIAGLDLVISVDTVFAHLAGAYATPVWTLVPADPDWRWMRRRADSPWYPTMRLFRQSRRRGWQPVLRRMRRALERAIARHREATRRPGVTLGVCDRCGLEADASDG